MTIPNSIRRFARDEDGAVTVDWVVLTAAIVSLGIAVLASVTAGTRTATTTISEKIATTEIEGAF